MTTPSIVIFHSKSLRYLFLLLLSSLRDRLDLLLFLLFFLRRELTLHLLFLGHLATDPPGPAHKSLQAQYLAVSLSLAELHR